MRPRHPRAPCGALIPFAVPAAYGEHYSAAVIPGEFLLIGAVFTALTVVTDDLLRAHGNPGFVSITQGAGGVVTIVGTLLFARRSLTEVALVSSLGFAVAFVLALIRLWVATRQPVNSGTTSVRAGRTGFAKSPSLRLSQPIAIPDRFSADFLAEPDYRICRNAKIYDAPTSDDHVHADPSRSYYGSPGNLGPVR